MDTGKIERAAKRAVKIFIVLRKGEITPHKVVDDLITKMKEYANYGFDYFQKSRRRIQITFS